MAKSKHRSDRRNRANRVIRGLATTSVAAVRRLRTERQAFASMPKPVPWEWARPRLVPLLAGPYFDRPGEPLVRSVLPPGIAVTFGIDLGRGVLPYVDAPVAERWECTAQQICDAAVLNLSRRIATVTSDDTKTGTLSGHMVRLLERPHGWATSVLLAAEDLMRIFGEHDQMFVAAGQGTLISLPTDVPSHVARDLVFEYESKEVYPLMLDPFGLLGGELHWAGSEDYADGDDEDGERDFVQIS